jgi:flagellar hook-associated protein 2
MAGTISFGGIGSGIDTESIVSGLVKASQGPLDKLKSQAAGVTAANTSLSQIGTLLGKLRTALEAVDETREVGSYAASSSSTAVTLSASGAALPGSYQVSVGRLASEQRSYSNGQTSASAALGATGSLGISVAGAAATNIALDAGDSLETIAEKINGAGLRVSAAVFHDGTSYRLQVRGLDTGAANTIAFSGTTLGLDLTANRRQDAQDSSVTIDNFTVTRPTNQVAGAILGVTLNLAATTTSPATVKVEQDPEGLKTKLNAVVSAYNGVVDAVHSIAGFGSTKASVQSLAGDSLLRSITARMSAGVGTVVGEGSYTTLGSIGVKLDQDGRMSLDSSKLNAALQADPAAVAKVIAGPTNGSGAADVLRDVVKAFSESGTGLVASKQTSMQSRLKDLNGRIDRETNRLVNYADALRKQFSALDASSGVSQLNSSYLTNFFK